MRTIFVLPVLLTALTPLATAQSNAIPGVDVNTYDIGTMSLYGRRGPAYPGGEVGLAFGHSFCNSGTVDVPWVARIGNQFTDGTFPKIAFLLAKETADRMVQVSGRSYLKHSMTAFNFSSGACAPCNRRPGAWLSIGCSDTYGPGFNSNRNRLGPPEEINPWLGTWNSVGSYFDRGDPSVGGAAAMDNVESLTFQMTSAFDPIKNRVEVRESELLDGGTYRAQAMLVIHGEPVANRSNNLRSKPASLSWSGSSWSGSTSGTSAYGSVLEHWTGATTSMAGNGMDDGRFLVAVKVTGPQQGMWRYEYAVHNIDNHRGGASFRLPVHASVQIQNVGVHDVDGDASNDWSFSRSGNQASFLAGANNALDWNNIFNFWFDASVGPAAGLAEIDQARVGPGVLTVGINTEVPGVSASVTSLGSGCGGLTLAASAAPVLGSTIQLNTAQIPGGAQLGATLGWSAEANPALDLSVIGMAGCVMHGTGPNFLLPFVAPIGTSESRTLAMPNDPTVVGVELVLQSFVYQPSPLLTPLGVIASNGLRLVLGN